MIKRLAVLLSISLFAALPAAADFVTLGVDAGLLTDQNGNPISDGGALAAQGAGDLILLIASPSGTFSPTGAGQFVSGDNLILGSSTGVVGSGAFEMTDQGSTPGESDSILSFELGYGSTGNAITTNSSIVAGDILAIRWYTNFTLKDFEDGLTPTSGYYGTYTATTNLDNGSAWVIPVGGTVETNSPPPLGDPAIPGAALAFFTSTDSLGGDQDPALGEALTPVISGDIAVPEPSTYALLATGLLFLAGVAVRRKRLAVAVTVN